FKSADKKLFNSVNHLCIIVNKRMTNSITQYPNGPVVQAIRVLEYAIWHPFIYDNAEVIYRIKHFFIR
ncbi:hypothetical protein QJA14_25190, partial [Escherichia coli]|uniref:hypothetical protein n=1 Tax=Escherichia coli TaxID=562 RepID=UPI003007D519